MNKEIKISKDALGVVVKFQPQPYWKNEIVDLTDYKHRLIRAIIPVEKRDGFLLSLETGKPVNLEKGDQLRRAGLGDAFDFPDGRKIICTRRWIPGQKEPEYFLTERTRPDGSCHPVKVFENPLEKLE